MIIIGVASRNVPIGDGYLLMANLILLSSYSGAGSVQSNKRHFTIVLFSGEWRGSQSQWMRSVERREVGRARSVGVGGGAMVKCSVGGAEHAAPPSPFTGRPPAAPRPAPLATNHPRTHHHHALAIASHTMLFPRTEPLAPRLAPLSL